MSFDRSAAMTAASADSRITVRIVPSTGLATAPYAVFAPFESAWARSRPLKRDLAGEGLGHAPEDLARDHAGVAAGTHQRTEADRRRDPVDGELRHAFGLLEGGLDGRVHVRARVAVRDRVDVQAVDLVDVGLEVRRGGPERLEQRGPVAGPTGHQATSVPLAASSSVRTPGAAAGAAGQVAGLVAEAVDVDRQPADLAAERSPDRVADRRIDLAGDLGDRHAVGDRQVEVDGEARRATVERADPGLGEPEPFEEAGDEPAGEAGHPIGTQRRGPDDIDDGSAAD